MGAPDGVCAIDGVTAKTALKAMTARTVLHRYEGKGI